MTTDLKTVPNDIKTSVTNNENTATTTISVSAPYSYLESRYQPAFKDLAKKLKVDGFRPGKVPNAVALKQLPELIVLEQAGRELMADLYLPLLKESKVDGIGEPKVTITKLAKDNPFEFTITLANFPKVELGDYKKIKTNSKKATQAVVVEDKELDEALETLRFQWAQQEKYYATLEEADSQEEKVKIDPRQIKVEDSELPEVNDAWIKQLGPYTDVADFKAKFRENIKANKEINELERRQGEALMELVNTSTFSVPQMVYDAELDRLIAIRKDEVKNAGLTWNQYLTSLGKSEAELKVEMAPMARERTHSQIAINELAEQENLMPSNEDIKPQAEALFKRYPEANQANLVAYVQSQLTASNVLQYLANTETNKVANKPSKAKSVSKAKNPSTKTKDTPNKA